MIPSLIVSGLFCDIFGVLLLVWVTNEHLKILTDRWGRIPVGSGPEQASRDNQPINLFSKRRTQGGIILLCIGFSLQILGLII